MSVPNPQSGARRKSRISGDVLILAAFLLLFAGLSYRILDNEKPEQNPANEMRRSSNVARPGGWKAFYLLLQKRGDGVERFERSPREWPADSGVVVTAPYSGGGSDSLWTPHEADDAVKWVESGGTLIAFTGADDWFCNYLGVFSQEPRYRKDESKKRPKGRASDEDDDPTVKAARLSRPPLTFLQPLPPKTPLAICQPAAFLEGVRKIVPAEERRYHWIPAAGITLVGDRLPLVVAVQRGKGRIVAISDAGMVDNGHLSKGDNARFAAQLVESMANPTRPRILFDEYHQNYQQSDSFWTAIGRPGQLAAGQLLVLVLLMVYSYSRRFGLPVPAPEPPRVSSEYVASLSDLYRRAQATDAALEGIYGVFWRDLCRAAGVPPETEPDDVATRAAALAPIPDAERAALALRIRDIVVECRQWIAAATAEAEATAAEEAERLAAVRAAAEAKAAKRAGKSGGKTAGAAAGGPAMATAAPRARRRRRRNRSYLPENEMLRLTTEIGALRKELDLGGAVSASGAA